MLTHEALQERLVLETDPTDAGGCDRNGRVGQWPEQNETVLQTVRLQGGAVDAPRHHWTFVRGLQIMLLLVSSRSHKGVVFSP